jgi:hypothetical protein
MSCWTRLKKMQTPEILIILLALSVALNLYLAQKMKK